MNFPRIDMRRTGQWLRFLCRKEQITVVELQKVLHIASNQAIYAWFNGKSLPSLDNICALSYVLHMPIDDLLVLEGKLHPFFKRIRKEERRMAAYAYKLIVQAS